MSFRLSPGTIDSMAGVLAPPKKYRLGTGGGSGKKSKAGGTLLALAAGAMISKTKPSTNGYRPGAQAKHAFQSGTHAGASANATRTAHRIATRSPEVVVRITGRQNGAGHVLANFSYIARLGHGAEQELPLYTSDGDIVRDGRDMQILAQDWQQWEMGDNARRQGATSISMILSMPAGTDPEALKDAGLAFAREEFANRAWVAALHVDRDHPHLHLTVARRDLDGHRFHPDRDDLYRYRQRFAEKLRDQGIEANATPARACGIDPAHEHIGVKNMRARGVVPDLDKGRAVRAEASREGGPPDAVGPVLARQRATVMQAYARSIAELSTSPSLADQVTAKSLERFVAALPAVEANSARAVRVARERGSNPNVPDQSSDAPKREPAMAQHVAELLARVKASGERSDAKLKAVALRRAESPAIPDPLKLALTRDVGARSQAIVDKAADAPPSETQTFLNETFRKVADSENERRARQEHERDRARDKDREGPRR